MLEEMNVEKKNLNRSGQGPAKGICTESKKTQDPSNGIKTFSKNVRKRDNSSLGNGSKLDQSRKPLTQKGKAFDKRLYNKSRGQPNACGKEGLQMRDDEYDGPELDGFFVPETRKQNYNYLLKFHYAPRGENSSVWKMPQRGQQTCSPRALMATHAHKYNKEEFLQATCQFVVREGVDYTANLFNPDVLVDWQHIELIVTGSSETVMSCPICLYPPTAAKMTRCGHIFCWRCILHYLALSDKTWRKCPICFESVHEKDLKSAVCLNKTFYQVGERILLKLMKSEKGRPVVCPIGEWSSREGRSVLSYGENCLDTVYSKLLVASKNQILDIINREYLELQSQVDEFKGCPEICFVEKALELLANRKSQIEINEPETEISNIIAETLEENKTEFECGNSSTVNALQALEITKDLICDNVSNSSLVIDASVKKNNEEKVVGDIARTSTCEVEDENVISESINITDEDVNVIPEDQLQSSSNVSKYYYFYQASDGQEIYLNKINVRMLEMAYGSLENCPTEIEGKILEKEAGSMTRELRKRFRYFSHLPITTTFEIVELDIKDLVSIETLAHFHETLDKRQKRRQQVAKKEKQREKKIDEQVRSQYLRSCVPAPSLKIESRYDFPECGTATEDFRALSGDAYPAISEADYSGLAYSPQEETGLERTRGAMGGLAIGREEAAGVALEEVKPSSSNEDTGGVSFAQMLRAGKTLRAGETMARPGFGGDGWGGGRSSGGGAGTTSRRTRQPSVTSSLESAGEEDREFAAPAHPPSLSLTQLIRMAEACSDKGGETTTTGGNRKKKKKTQQKLLFSTGGLPKGI